VEAADRRRRCRARSRGDEGDRARADGDDVAAGQPPPRADPLAVDERPVARELLVSEHPVACDPLERRVEPGDLAVPAQRHVGLRAPPDRQPPAALVEQHEDLPAVRVAVDEVRHTEPLRREPLLQLDRPRTVRIERMLSHMESVGR
jgi:hypothetical protein